ncbi:MAG TPA: Vi polysaccharide biosynthesis UDP-N-acetylglucosamine C-6 dehydrogenase TviB [bacterium]|nr:Vi polysaccharide biosynthesis UDP-N-acetylglucosamine C-6 dehydrogenase TviB [bacterium]
MEKICIIGLGYVGLPLAVEFGKKFDTIGFDINKDRISELEDGKDSTREVDPENLKKAEKLIYTSQVDDIKDAKYYIVTVPTPIDENKIPDLTPVKKASETVGKVLTSDNIVIYESTVYPGATEEVCVPILEEHSGLKYNEDFYCGYSPERINPGDKVHTVKTIQKVTSGSTPEVAEIVDQLYQKVITAGTHKASSIKVAEAAKVIENAQRDINIAFVNELAVVFNRLGIDTLEVLEAAGTKWNFLDFRPGLVGGHCIGVDPYYLAHKAKAVGYNPEIILSGRRLNDNMGTIVSKKVIKLMIHKGHTIAGSKVLIMGFTFKENCPDIRNTRVIDLKKEMEDFGCNVDVYEPLADNKEVEREYGFSIISNQEDLDENYDAIIAAVAHDEFKNFDIKKFKNGKAVVYDVKGFLDRDLVDCRL